MIGALWDDLQQAQQIDLVRPGSQLYEIMHFLKTRDIKTSMPIHLRNRDGHIFFINIVSHTFPDKEAHKRITLEYIIKLEITESNSMEGQYYTIQGNDFKKITNHIVRKYHNIESAPFQTGFNMITVTGPKLQLKYGWLCTLLEWTNSMRHDRITQNIWPKPETSINQELHMIPMH
jgi:hypothetical protein